MDTWVWIVIVAAAAVLLVVLFWALRSRQQRGHLQDQFGTEYDRSVSSEGRKDAEHRLSEVEREHEELDIRPLSTSARERYLEEWRQVEARFVNDPADATRSAGSVVERVLAERGYPTNGDAEHRVAHVAVDHPDVAERYRHGRAMLESDESDTEHLRKAMVDFRTVFDQLVTTDARTTE